MRGRQKPWHWKKAGPIPVVSGVFVSDISDTTLTVNFTTDIPARGAVRYGTTSALGSEVGATILSTTHAITVTGLTGDTVYSYQPVAYGHSGAGYGAIATIATSPVGNSPVISNVIESAITETSARVSWNVEPATTGKVRYGTTTAYGSETTLETDYLTYHSQAISSLTAGTTYYYQIVSSAADGQTITYSDSFTTLGSGVVTGLYGVWAGFSDLQNVNTRPSSYGVQQTCRFRASTTSTITRFVFYIVGPFYRDGSPTSTGYAAGTGGTLKCSLQRDDGTGKPDGTDIGNTFYIDPYEFTYLWQTEPDYPATGMSGWAVEEGNIYHILFENDDPDPASNYVALDWAGDFAIGQSWTTDFTWSGERGPRFDAAYGVNDDLTALRMSPSGWQWNPNLYPCIQIEYASGGPDGYGYFNRTQTSTWYQLIATTSKRLRQQFSVSGGNKTVDGLYVRMCKTAGVTDALVVELQDSGGTPVTNGSVTIAASTVPDYTGNAQGRDCWWVGGALPANVTLTNGQTYYLELRTSGTGSYQHWVATSGSAYDYEKVDPIIFPDGPGNDHTQITTNGGSTWTGLYAASGDWRTQYADVQFVFTLT